MTDQNGKVKNPVFGRGGFIPGGIAAHEDFFRGIPLFGETPDAVGLAAHFLGADQIHMIQEAEPLPLLPDRLGVGAGNHDHIRLRMRGGQGFLHALKGFDFLRGKRLDRTVDGPAPGQRLLKNRMAEGFLFNGIVGELRSGIRPGLQGFDAVDGRILRVDLTQRHGQTLEAVDAPGKREEIDHIPPVQNGLFPPLKAPFLHHAGAEAAEMLDIHGIHGAAVRVDADGEALFPCEIIQCGHVVSLLHGIVYRTKGMFPALILSGRNRPQPLSLPCGSYSRVSHRPQKTVSSARPRKGDFPVIFSTAARMFSRQGP